MTEDISPHSPRRSRRWLAAVGLSVFAILAATGLGDLGWLWAGTSRTEMAQWIMAGASLFTLVAAVVAGVYAAGAFRLESAREERWFESERRTQASLVAAWPIDVITGWMDTDDPEEPAIGPVEARVQVRNFSSLPVTNVTLQVLVKMIPIVDGEPQDVDEVTWLFGETAPTLLPPTHEELLTILPTSDPVWPEKVGFDMAEVFYEAMVSIEFVDASGVGWLRPHAGGLFEQRQPRGV